MEILRLGFVEASLSGLCDLLFKFNYLFQVMSLPLPVWWDGRLIPGPEALVPAHSQGLLWGRGVFETLLVTQARPLALTRHLVRLAQGAARLGLDCPEEFQLRHAVQAVLAACPPEPHRLRITLTGAEDPALQLHPGTSHLHLRLLPVSPADLPFTLLTAPWRRNAFSPLAGVKSTSYAENALSLDWAQRHGAQEALLLNTDGQLCEGSLSNVFLIRGETLLTPPLESGCLPGITRGLVLELCASLGIPALEKPLTPADLSGITSLFLTNSLHGILPVSRCDRIIFPAACPLTARLSAALADLFLRQPDP